MAASAVWAARLTLGERMMLAIAALGALDEEEVEEVATAMLGGAGGPLPPFINTGDEARHWASYASLRELKHSVAAAFDALPIRDRSAFLDHARQAA